MRIGAIGAGAWGRNIVRTLTEMGALAAVADPSPSVRAAVTEQFGVPVFDSACALLRADVEAVAVATPAPTHAAVVQQALNAGKHVFVEKPLCLCASEGEALCTLAEAQGRVLMVGHLLLYQPAVAALRAAIAAGLIGDLLGVHQERLNLGRARAQENALWSLGVHDVAVVLHLVQSEPCEVRASGYARLTPGVHDDVYLHVVYANSVQSSLHVSWLWPERLRRTTVVGSRAMLVFDEVAQSVVLHRKSIDNALGNVDDGAEELQNGRAEPLRLELEHFVECCRTGREPLSSGRSALPVLRILERADRAMAGA